MSAGCPTEDELVALVEHALPPDALTALEAHVASCEACADVVGNLGALAEAERRYVDRYRLDRRIGAGGMGEVWAAFDPQLRRDVAIKLVRTDRRGSKDSQRDRERERLLREARALAKLKHENVVKVHDVGTHAGEVFIVSELVVGETLGQYRSATTDWRAVTALYAQAARGLDAAHVVGLVHRDVKPANLLVGTDGRVRVVDFGLAVPANAPVVGDAETPDAEATAAAAAAVLASITERGHIAGTPAYMAPEQRAGRDVGAPADQYALAVALIEAITGERPPYDPKRPRALDRAAVTKHVADRRALEPALEQLCAHLSRALAFDPSERFATMAELADALDEVSASADPAAPASVQSQRSTRSKRISGVASPIANVEPDEPETHFGRNFLIASLIIGTLVYLLFRALST